MKAASRFLGAVYAVALSAALAVPGAVALQLVSVSVAQAAVVSSIDVRGNQRVEAQTIRDYVTIKPGKTFSSADIDESVKRLFGTGLFSDVSVNQVGGTLVVAGLRIPDRQPGHLPGQQEDQGRAAVRHRAAQAARHLLARPDGAGRRGDPPGLLAHRSRRRDRVGAHHRSRRKSRQRRLRDQRRWPHQDQVDRLRRQRSLQRPPPRGRHRDEEVVAAVLRDARRPL